MRYDMIALHASLLTSVSAAFGHAPLGSLYTYLLIHTLIAPYVCLGASSHCISTCIICATFTLVFNASLCDHTDDREQACLVIMLNHDEPKWEDGRIL